MKMLYLNGYFLLPDDFEGSLNDALLEIVEYRKTNKYMPHPSNKNPDELILIPDEDIEQSKTLYSNLMIHMREDTGKRLSYAYSICKLKDDGLGWEILKTS